MRDTLFTAVLTFAVLAAGSAATFSELLTTKRSPAPRPVVTLPAVTVVAKRAGPVEVVLLPAVTVTGKRAV